MFHTNQHYCMVMRSVIRLGPAFAAREIRIHLSITNSQQLLPLPDVPLESHALGNLESRDDASLDLLPALL